MIGIQATFINPALWITTPLDVTVLVPTLQNIAEGFKQLSYAVNLIIISVCLNSNCVIVMNSV